MRKLVQLTSLVLACHSFTALANAEETVRIVSSLPRTGSANTQSTSIAQGIKLAIDEIGGKISGKGGEIKIEYSDWDNASPERGQWDPALEAANADKAINDPSVIAYIGPYNSGAAKISIPKLNQAGLAMVNGFATNPVFTKPGFGEANEPAIYRPSGKPNFFRIVPADDVQGAVAAQWAQEMGVKKVFILDDREVYGKGIAKIFRQTAEKLGVEVVGYEGIDPKAANYKSLATKIKQKAPDLVYFGGTTQTNAGQIVKDLRASGSKVKFMVPDGCFEAAFIEAAGKNNIEGNTFITFGGVPPSKLEGRGKNFVESYVKAYGTEPSAYGVYGYESARVIIAALRRVGTGDRAAIREAIAQLRDFDGVLGKWSFDDNGDSTLRVMSGNTVKAGEFEFVKLLGAAG